MAAQKLKGQGFKEVINLSGGIKAWNGLEAHGRTTQGMHLFENIDSVDQVLYTAYSLEQGLQDFYYTLMKRVSSEKVIDLFRKLAGIEDIHKDNIYTEYVRLSGKDDREAFEDQVTHDAMEGGMTTEEYLEFFQPDMEKEEEVLSLAMSIEAQALDLYTRAAREAKSEENRTMLERIAAEEKNHLQQLGKLLDNIVEARNG